MALSSHYENISDDDTSLVVKRSPPSNEKLLCTAFISFQCFATIQIIAAVIAGSEAMLGDSAAMMVDAFTYLFNWYAERRKVFYANKLRQHLHLSNESYYHFISSREALRYRKYTYQLEIIPPLISVSTLLVVTGFVLNDSISLLILDAKRDKTEQDNPDVNLMMIFSFMNLLLDIINVGCFASAKHALGYKTTNDNEDDVILENQGPTIAYRKSYSDDVDINDVHRDEDDNAIEMMERRGEDDKGEQSASLSLDGDNREANGNGEKGIYDHEVANGTDDDDDDDDGSRGSSIHEAEEEESNGDGGPVEARLSVTRSQFAGEKNKDDEKSNLNMCSAYTHVFADTLRSFAVIFASLLAEFAPSVTSEVADAAAAVVVSILIVLSLIPLFTGMVQTFRALKRINNLLASQRSEEEVHEEEGCLNGNESGLSTSALLQFV